MIVEDGPPRTTSLLDLSSGEIARLAASGVDHVTVPIAGATDAAHDWIRRAPGELARIRDAITDAQAHRVRVLAITPLHRSSYRSLAEVASWLSARRVEGWAIALLDGELTRDVPRLAIALPFALHAIARARASGIEARIACAPLCLLGPLATVALEGSARRAYGSPCARCPSRARCPGVSAPYLARFGDRELIARDAPLAAPSVISRALASAVTAGP